VRLNRRQRTLKPLPTTPVDLAVVDAMPPHFKWGFGNSSGSHALGKAAQPAVERGRAQMPALLGADTNEIVFIEVVDYIIVKSTDQDRPV
jgi:cysteine sulfinate desulfinase/cysteine desulfurase-like protein